MTKDSNQNPISDYFFGELKKIELTEDDTSGVFSYIAPPSPGFAPLGYPLGPVPRTPVMVAPSVPVFGPSVPYTPVRSY